MLYEVYQTAIADGVVGYVVKPENDLPNQTTVVFYGDMAQQASRQYATYMNVPNYVRDEPSAIAVGIAARVWCDQDMQQVAMDVDAAEVIARVIESVLRDHRADQAKKEVQVAAGKD